MQYPEIYIRRLHYEQAELKLKKELDELYMQEYKKIRIVHGKGQGILRQMTQDYLALQPFVKKFYEAPHFSGGNGVTIVEFY